MLTLREHVVKYVLTQCLTDGSAHWKPILEDSDFPDIDDIDETIDILNEIFSVARDAIIAHESSKKK